MYRILPRFLVLGFTACLLPPDAAAQELNFQHLLVPDGLPQTQVRAVHQSADGYIWVGTYGGAGRYNGREFAVFDSSDGLSSNTILTISSTRDGRVWMGTTTGLCWIDPGRSRFDCSAAHELRNSPVQDILDAGHGGLWIGAGDGLYRIERDDPANVSQSHLAGSNISDLKRDRGGTMWIATRAGLYRLDAGEDEPRRVVLPPDAGDVVLSIQPDAGALWIGTENGLFLRQGETIRQSPRLPPQWSQDNINDMTLSASGDVWIATNQGVLRHTSDGFDLLTEDSGLMSNITFTVFADREGVIWIGNDNGLTTYAPGPFVGYRTKHGLLHYFVRTMSEDEEGNLWLGSRAGAQRVPYRDQEWRFEESTVIADAEGLTDARVYSIAFPARDEALLATGDGVVHWREGEGVVRRYTMADGLPTNPSQALKTAPDGRTWIGTNLGVVILEDGEIYPAPDDELAEAYVFRIREDIHGRLWFGSQDRGLFRYDDGRVKQFMRDDGLTDKTIWDIAPDRHGGLWVGSNGDGLFHVAADGAIQRYTSADGLVNDFVWQVLVDDRDRVWTYTNTGISRLENGTFTNYGLDDGLLHLEGGATGAIQTHDGTLWFASADGLMRYVPEFESQITLPPPVLIERVTVGGEPIEGGARLPYEPGLLDIQYAALTFEGMGEVEYRYRLLGAGEGWSVTSRYRPISFANLGAGRYVFEVTARKAQGEWNPETARFEFHIQPPFWETAWFWLLALLLLGGMVWFFIHLKVEQARRRERELAAIVESRTRELKSTNEKLQHTATELKSVNARLEDAAITDPLTGLKNRRYLANQITTDVAQTHRLYRGESVYPNRDIVFLMVDIDFFKQVNDTYGHAAGDLVLKQYGQIIKRETRDSDYVVRWGGEEFLVIARNTEASQCNVIAERIQAAVEAEKFRLEDGTELTVTCSAGVSHLPLFKDEPDVVDWEHVIEIADTAVYIAKSLGRNGWVSIRGSHRGAISDSAELMKRIRSDMPKLVADGILVVDASFDEPLAAAPRGNSDSH